MGVNRLDSNFVFCFGLDASHVPIIDVRSPAVPVATLPGHASISAAQWAPHSAAHLMVADQAGLVIWDLKGDLERPQWTLPLSPPVQFVWPSNATDSVAYMTSSQLCVTKI